MEEGILKVHKNENFFGSDFEFCTHSHSCVPLKGIDFKKGGGGRNQNGPATSTLQENTIYAFLYWELRGLSPNFHIHVSVSDLYISRIGPHISLQQKKKADQSWKYVNLLQIYECRKWETEHYNYFLEITVSFLRIHKWKPHIYIVFSPALHLQCMYPIG
jgi:hypothetical protein